MPDRRPPRQIDIPEVEGRVVIPLPEPETPPSDPHLPPLDNPEDVKYLSEDDPRRAQFEEDA